jgi:type IV secretory pathway VirB2 component (pilin)
MRENKRIVKIIFAVLFGLALAPLYAASIAVPAGLESLVTGLQEVFTGGIVRAILVMCLAGSAVAYAFNKDNEKMKRNCIAVIIACVTLIAAATVVDSVIEASK